MKVIFMLLLATSCAVNIYAQNTLTVQIKDAVTNENLTGATVVLQSTGKGNSTNSNGIAQIKNIPNGKQVIVYSNLEYKKVYDTIIFPLADTATIIVYLKGETKSLDDVVISATRTSRNIKDIPTRVETITAGELEEKAVMQPANAKMILTESTGIQTQQTSATSANASIRIQGLDGKYTQLLKDGFPLYSGFSGGLSLVQIPPLDLKRVEVIKGASSTLYGGGAIAGLINFVTKVPTDKKELSFLINANHTKALDISGYYAQKFKKVGITFFASQNTQAAYDVENDGLTEIPKFTRYTFNPRIFFYINPSTNLSFGVNSSFENRIGGDIQVINNTADANHTYFEKNISNRVSTQLKFEKKYSNKSSLTFKNSVGYFNRDITKADYLFSGNQLSTFTELSYLFNTKKLEWIIGSNVWTEDFKQTNTTLYPLNSNLFIAGAFIQNSFKASSKLNIETGLRADVTNQNHFFLLPRIAAMYKLSNKFTTRLSGGLGYKTPTIFSEDAEEKGFRNIQPINLNNVNAENSIGGSFDVNFKTKIFDDVALSINQLFFYTRLNKPLVLNSSILPNGYYEFVNANGNLDSKGFETNLKVKLDDISLYCGYTYIDAQQHYNNTNTINPLTAKHRIYATLTYEIDDKLRVAYETFFTGNQQLDNGQTTPSYWIMGASVEYKINKCSLFLNAENFTDTRQSKYEKIYSGTIQNPQFKQLWTSTEGFVFNGGIKINVW